MSTDTVWVQVQHVPLDIAAAHSFLQTPGAGGAVVFVGTTRQWTDSRETLQLEYESYPPMAEKEMLRLATHAKERWQSLRVCLLHRLGTVPVGEASVVVGVATAHRAEAFEACRYLIDTLKRDVPIWKREHYADGTTEWVGNPAASQV